MPTRLVEDMSYINLIPSITSSNLSCMVVPNFLMLLLAGQPSNRNATACMAVQKQWSRTFLHNDHQNLEAIALSTVPMIVRIRIYLQSYIMLWRHVSGPLSVGGDFMSRMHQYAKPAPLSLPAADSAPENSIALLAKDDISSALDSVHGSRNGHLGYRATYLANSSLATRSLNVLSLTMSLSALCAKRSAIR